ncbi:hypothetical protein BJ165DRAFT_1520441 [Panaeolus papilionaceus]|nr:hypothetical protein BJ165DRAFT_1520441 [Panaeolus papilionaceus]
MPGYGRNRRNHPRYHHTANNQTSSAQSPPVEDQIYTVSMFSGSSRMIISGGNVNLTTNGAVRRVIVNQGPPTSQAVPTPESQIPATAAA